jgi:very-short-patch-repair endonuclease
MNDIQYSKTCNCGNIVYYKTKDAYWANKNKNAPCRKCKHIHQSKIMSGRKRAPFDAKWKRNLAIGHKKSAEWKTSMNTPEYKEKHRKKMLKMIREGKSSVAFNPKACDVFDFLNNRMHWNGQHAKNGKEQVVDVFFLDYYEPTLNVAIEWDEAHHHKAKHRQQDGWKSKVVMNTIGCEFYRVDEISKQVKKIDHSPTDRTNELQQVINEYYGNNK